LYQFSIQHIHIQEASLRCYNLRSCINRHTPVKELLNLSDFIKVDKKRFLKPALKVKIGKIYRVGFQHRTFSLHL
jgi:hypothetical protein